VPSESPSGVALVTGGGREIGAGIARELANDSNAIRLRGRTGSFPVR
jgi:NAD(P)-dependent dehydrogenase (short-subunit alcohol dehydrogenase family)